MPANQNLSGNGNTFAQATQLIRKVAAWVLPAIALVFILFWIRPWQPPAATAEDMAGAWNDSIRKLGIEPLFPPQEDFAVGDIWAVIAAYDESPGQTREASPNETIVGKGVRIGRISLAQLGYEPDQRPTFPVTQVKDDQLNFDEPMQTDLRQEGNPDGRVRLSFVSFPDFTLVDRSTDAGSLSSVLGLSAERGSNRTEVIKIPIALTYSVAAPKAMIALNRWCIHKDNEGMCSDEIIRSVIAYSLQNKVFEQLDGKYRYRFEIKLVTQTYMTRRLELRRGAGAAVNSRLGDGDVPKLPAAEPDQQGTQATGQTGIGRNGDSRFDFGIDKVTYPKPIVFGFRSVSLTLQPAEPGK